MAFFDKVHTFDNYRAIYFIKILLAENGGYMHYNIQIPYYTIPKKNFLKGGYFNKQHSKNFVCCF